MRARIWRGLILALSSLSLVAAFSLTNVPAAHAAVPCTTFWIDNSTSSTRSVTVSNSSHVWYTIPIGESRLGAWRKIRIETGYHIYLSPPGVWLNESGWRTISQWTCTTTADYLARQVRN